jgi:hypothetical protein
MNRRDWYSVGFIQKGKRVVFEFQVVILTLLGVSIDNQEKTANHYNPDQTRNPCPYPNKRSKASI